MTDEILATVQASAPRRWLGVGMMFTLGALLLYIALTMPPANLGWQAFLVALGLAALALAEKSRKATEGVIELTRDGLRDTSGEVIASLSNIASVERGTFAMKPSNGFLVHLKTPRTRRWQPGLWWAMGRRIGIGGVTPGSQTKFMAQTLEAVLAEQNAQDDQTS